MNEEIAIIIETSKESMEMSVQHLEKELLNIRAGKANPIMLNSVVVDYYGNQTPLNQVANINTPDGRTLSIQPWEKSDVARDREGNITSQPGVQSHEQWRISDHQHTPLTEERRRELVKLAKSESENAKVGIRNARKDANNEIKQTDSSEDLQKNAEIDVQELTDQFIKKVEDILSIKEKEILTV